VVKKRIRLLADFFLSVVTGRCFDTVTSRTNGGRQKALQMQRICTTCFLAVTAKVTFKVLRSLVFMPFSGPHMISYYSSIVSVFLKFKMGHHCLYI